ncbi:MAG: CRISPR-associated ring nuclease [Candidatus Caldarchaeum sp.]
MRVAAVASMGTSPPVVTEFVEYVQRVERLQHLAILSTSEKMVRDGARLVEVALNIRYPHISVKVHELPVSDITDEEENYMFMEYSVKVVADLRRRYDVLHICLAGGRKEMVASLTMIAQLASLSSVYHVVSPYIKEMNVELERIRHDIEMLASSEDPRRYYELNREKFDRVMFPPAESYSIVAVPIIPYPAGYVAMLKKILGGELSGRDVRDRAWLEQLRMAGLISLTSGGDVVVTDEGKKLYSRVLKHL